MRLDSIRLVNYRGHADLNVKFAPRFNAVVGINGSGKTTLLKGLCEAMRASGMANVDQPFLLSEEGSVRKIAVKNGSRVRFEEQYPLKIDTSGRLLNQDLTWSIAKSNAAVPPEWSYPDGQAPQFAYLGMKSAEVGADAIAMPLMVFYRANRQWSLLQPDPIQATTERQSRFDAYENWWDASSSASALQSWVIAKYLERLQLTQETQGASSAIDDDELALVDEALVKAIDGARGIRYDIKERSLLTYWQADPNDQRETIAFESLSDGQRTSIALIVDIARRMCLLNPQLGKDVITKTDGVVLIDELDMHLHPKWQRLITTGLKKAFPSIQFIVATHSPQVLGELEPGEIILLRPGQTSHPQVSYGLDSSRVLEEVMGTTARSAEIDTALSELFASLEGNDLNSARNQLTLLTTKAPAIPELAGAEALLKRKELLGR